MVGVDEPEFLYFGPPQSDFGNEADTDKLHARTRTYCALCTYSQEPSQETRVQFGLAPPP